jgi:hypothetical protein
MVLASIVPCDTNELPPPPRRLGASDSSHDVGRGHCSAHERKAPVATRSDARHRSVKRDLLPTTVSKETYYRLQCKKRPTTT